MVNNQSDVRHEPVLVSEVARLLITDTSGAYLDLTAGGGGHLRALAARLESRARLYGLDADEEAVERTTGILQDIDQACRILRGAFGALAKLAPQFEEEQFSGILLDLGLSSYQLEDEQRGFSFRHEGPLDMRFDRSSGRPASDLIEGLTQKELTQLIREYGEERQAARIAAAIVRERQKSVIATTAQLADIVTGIVKPPHQNKSLARVFQALRIAVNRELDQLSEVLPAAMDLLTAGGRLAIISYHSLEDRIVKRFFQTEARGRAATAKFDPSPDPEATPRVKIVTRKPVTPGEQEQLANPRARSAKLRVGERL
jgi:16S rRNA (cytosine1402-N4)-methyltransferase